MIVECGSIHQQIIKGMIDWEQVRIDAAISAMQGVLESGTLGEILEAAPEVVAKQAIRLADVLIMVEQVINYYKEK